jgi:hypothetical protein
VSRQRRAYSIVAGVIRFIYAALSSPGVSTPVSSLCGRITRHYIFITADFLFLLPRHAAAAGLLNRLAGGINCFWLIKASKCHLTVSKQGAS